MGAYVTRPAFIMVPLDAKLATKRLQFKQNISKIQPSLQVYHKQWVKYHIIYKVQMRRGPEMNIFRHTGEARRHWAGVRINKGDGTKANLFRHVV